MKNGVNYGRLVTEYALGNVLLEETEISILNKMFTTNLLIYKRKRSNIATIYYCSLDFVCKANDNKAFQHFYKQLQIARENTRAFRKFVKDYKSEGVM